MLRDLFWICLIISVLSGAFIGVKSFLIVSISSALFLSWFKFRKPKSESRDVEMEEVEIFKAAKPSKTKPTITRAIETGEVIRIKYLSGSESNQPREISPIRFEKGEKVRAYCHKDKRDKTFNLNKILIEDIDDAG